jgi:nucleotidyltransferase/DNA polymerase involved in DNA repair
MDAFYASVEQRDNPQYRGTPLVLGGSPNKRGAIAQEVQERIERNGAKGRTITLKVKFADYRQITRSRTMLDYVASKGQVLAIALDLLKNVDLEAQAVRLLGITLSNLDTEMDEPSCRQLELDLQLTTRLMPLDATMDWS